ncbi:FAD-binding oxidoreductase [Paenibacillus sp. OV219]|uniref:FAD-binding oxidoreductase n=1 Tax=Paenibacillus sp. OV219 TaxID=1884377 RepID=UPI0008D422F6|nr:FAD-binding oxidoreductase [Paenibacillus sp. OV219]SEO76733.1 FAD/FMN-containing dehydrogenase [Paenibacillus sp. OV219]
MGKGWESDVAELLGEKKLVLDSSAVEKLSKDYYWYSPVLDAKLRGKIADGAVKADSEEDVAKTLAYAYAHRIPITPRGAGTGNYGQAVPLEGGILLDVSGLNKIVEIGNGYARCQCGVKLGVLEKAVRESGQELRIYPSTLMVATIGGFISGGSGGIGSITWGNLWDGNVLEATIYTMEQSPKRVIVSGTEVQDYIHSYGTTGIVTEVVIPLAPARLWQESICQFDSLEEAALFGNAVAHDVSIPKRMVSLSEWPLPSYFTPLAKQLEKGSAAVLLETEEGYLEAVSAHAKQANGRMGYVKDSSQYRKGISLSDFTWNHTTLWSLRADPSYTYLQSGFSATSFMDQIASIKGKFGDEVLLHMEWMMAGGVIFPIALPVIRYSTEERLYEIVAYFETIGVSVSDPHTWTVSPRSTTYGGMVERKRVNDPLGLLNPGKLVADPAD